MQMATEMDNKGVWTHSPENEVQKAYLSLGAASPRSARTLLLVYLSRRGSRRALIFARLRRAGVGHRFPQWAKPREKETDMSPSLESPVKTEGTLSNKALTWPTAQARERRIDAFVAELNQMSSEERVRASRYTFDRWERWVYAARFPDEVPRLNGELEWIAATLE
jgi:hypothetical protein